MSRLFGRKNKKSNLQNGPNKGAFKHFPAITDRMPLNAVLGNLNLNNSHLNPLIINNHHPGLEDGQPMQLNLPISESKNLSVGTPINVNRTVAPMSVGTANKSFTYDEVKKLVTREELDYDKETITRIAEMLELKRNSKEEPQQKEQQQKKEEVKQEQEKKKIYIPMSGVFDEIPSGLSKQTTDKPSADLKTATKKKDCQDIFEKLQDKGHHNMIVDKCEGKHVLIVSHNKKIMKMVSDMFPDINRGSVETCKYGIANCSVLEISKDMNNEPLIIDKPANLNYLNNFNGPRFTSQTNIYNKGLTEWIKWANKSIKKYKLKVLFDGFPDKEKCIRTTRGIGGPNSINGPPPNFNRMKQYTSVPAMWQDSSPEQRLPLPLRGAGNKQYNYMVKDTEFKLDLDSFTNYIQSKTEKETVESSILYKIMQKADKIIIVRHGNGIHNKPYEKKTVVNPPLTPLGVYQAYLAGKYIIDQNNDMGKGEGETNKLFNLNNSVIFTSRLKRAQHTTLQFLHVFLRRYTNTNTTSGFTATPVATFQGHLEKCIKIYNDQVRDRVLNRYSLKKLIEESKFFQEMAKREGATEEFGRFLAFVTGIGKGAVSSIGLKDTKIFYEMVEEAESHLNKSALKKRRFGKLTRARPRTGMELTPAPSNRGSLEPSPEPESPPPIPPKPFLKITPPPSPSPPLPPRGESIPREPPKLTSFNNALMELPISPTPKHFDPWSNGPQVSRGPGRQPHLGGRVTKKQKRATKSTTKKNIKRRNIRQRNIRQRKTKTIHSVKGKQTKKYQRKRIVKRATKRKAAIKRKVATKRKGVSRQQKKTVKRHN